MNPGPCNQDAPPTVQGGGRGGGGGPTLNRVQHYLSTNYTCRFRPYLTHTLFVYIVCLWHVYGGSLAECTPMKHESLQQTQLHRGRPYPAPARLFSVPGSGHESAGASLGVRGSGFVSFGFIPCCCHACFLGMFACLLGLSAHCRTRKQQTVQKERGREGQGERETETDRESSFNTSLASAASGSASASCQQSCYMQGSAI